MPKQSENQHQLYELVSEDSSITLNIDLEDIERTVVRMVGTNVTIGKHKYGYIMHAEFNPRIGIIGYSKEEEYAETKPHTFFKISRSPFDSRGGP